MATYSQGILGPFNGMVGPIIGYTWRGKECFRTYRKHIRFPHTEGQLAQRDWFLSMVRFASTATPALRLGLRDVSTQEGCTESNYFIKQNKTCFHHTPKGVEVDFSRLSIAEGPAANVGFKAADFKADEVVSIAFDKNMKLSRTSGDDRVYLYAYCPDLRKGFLSSPAQRRSKVISTTLPQAWSGMEVHLYGFVVDRTGAPSNSVYIGVGKVNHYEERGVYIPVNKEWNEFVEIASRQNNSPESNNSLSNTPSGHSAPQPSGPPRQDDPW